jgi:competence protein ComEC
MVRFGRHVAGLAVVSMLATAATAPFTVYHFGRLPAYGVFANMLAVPLAEIWVMPWGLLALALMPFGLEDWALAPMGLGIAGLVGIADGFAALPGAALILPSFSTPSLVAMSLGGLWICMWRESHRWLGVGLVGVGLATAPLERFPDILISADGRAIAVRLENGRYSLSSRQQRFVSDAWLRRAGQSEAELWPKPGTADGGMSCDRVGCRIRMPYRPEVWAVLQPEGLRAACSASDAVVVTGLWVKNCSKPQLVIDRSALQRNGTHALWLDPGRVRAESVRRWQGARPWVPRPPWSHNRPND